MKEERVLKEVLKDYDVDIIHMGISKYIDGTNNFPIKMAIGFEDYENGEEIKFCKDWDITMTTILLIILIFLSF